MITKKVQEIYHEELNALKKELPNNEGRFAVTLDEWKASNRNKFLGVTLHFYYNSFELKNFVIGFEVLNKVSSITGEELMKFVQKVIGDLALDGRILSITREI